MWTYIPTISPSLTPAPAPECSANPSSSDSNNSASPVELFVILSGTAQQRPLSWHGWKARPWIKLLSVTGGSFRRFGEQLSGLGYTIEDPLFIAAEDVGAPHERERVFILAVANADFDKLIRRCGNNIGAAGEVSRRWGQQDGEPSGRNGFADGSGAELDHPASAGQRTIGRGRLPASDAREGCKELGDPEHGGAPGLHRESGARRRSKGSNGGCLELGDPECRRRQAGNEDVCHCGESERGSSTRTELRCGQLPIFPPGRGDPANPDHPDWWAWAAIAAVAAARLPRFESCDAMGLDGMARADLLRIGGNGVVVLQAACAFSFLMRRILQ